MVDKILFSNNATSTLASAVVTTDVTLLAAPGTGSLFPNASISQGTFFYVVLEDAAGVYEVCKCTNVTGDVLTVERAQDNTSAQSFPIGARMELRLVAASQQALVQRDPDNFVELRGATLRATETQTDNELVIPSDGSRPTIGAKPIVVKDEDPDNPGFAYDDSHYFVPRGIILMWSGTTATIPNGWALCDGANGTPDLTDKFIKAATVDGGSQPYGSTGGEHNTTLTTSNLPSHAHEGGSYKTLPANTTEPSGVAPGQQGSHSHDVYSTAGGATALGLDGRSGFGVSGNPSNSPMYSDLYVPYSGAHYHGIPQVPVTGLSGEAGGGTSFTNQPAYYALAMIMKL